MATDELLAQIEDRLALQLEERERHLKALDSGIGVWDWHSDTDELIWNREMLRMWGYALDGSDFPGNYSGFISRVHPDDAANVEKNVAQAMADGDSYNIRYRVCPPGKKDRVIIARGLGHKKENGRLERMVGVCVDVTDLVRC